MALSIIFTFLAVLGLLLFVLGLRRIWRWKMVSGSVQGISGALLITLALMVASLAANLHTYQRLTHESPVASLRFDRIGPRYFRAYLQRPGQTAEIYDLHGDEWQLDARILKWHGWANLLGLDSGFQLERLSGRYRDAGEEKRSQHDVYPLYKSEGVDIWRLARNHPRWLPWVDAVYGSATYMPMSHGARYAISMSQSGLVARPLNDAARRAVKEW